MHRSADRAVREVLLRIFAQGQQAGDGNTFVVEDTGFAEECCVVERKGTGKHALSRTNSGGGGSRTRSAWSASLLVRAYMARSEAILSSPLFAFRDR